LEKERAWERIKDPLLGGGQGRRKIPLMKRDEEKSITLL